MTDVTISPLSFRTLRLGDQPSFDEAVRSFEGSGFTFAFGYRPGDDFAFYLQQLDEQSRGINLGPAMVPALFFVGVVGEMIIGRLSFRLALNESLLHIGGHIGFAVCPQFRGQGYAKAMLREALELAPQHGISRILLTCDTTNKPSQSTIVACGGVLENTVLDKTTGMAKERYWIGV